MQIKQISRKQNENLKELIYVPKPTLANTPSIDKDIRSVLMRKTSYDHRLTNKKRSVPVTTLSHFSNASLSLFKKQRSIEVANKDMEAVLYNKRQFSIVGSNYISKGSLSTPQNNSS